MSLRGDVVTSGIDKRAADRIEVLAPDEGPGSGSGVVGDLIGNGRHHGGVDKAVYAFSREELDVWEGLLDRTLPDGMFGENLTTEGLDLEALVLGQRLRVGRDVVLEVSLPRQPCSTFQRHLGERGWVRRFTGHGRCGTYLRVLAPGIIRPDDMIEALREPDHGVDIRTAFAAAMGDDGAAARVIDARCLPQPHHDRLLRRLGGGRG